MEIKLLVIRTPDIEKLSEFYSRLGLKFEYHKHGNSPYHYSASIGKTVLEIYPLTKSQTEADKNFRLGFSLDDFDSVLQNLREANVIFSSEPVETEFGLMAVVVDPDGRKVELSRD